MWRSGELLAITQQWTRATDVRPVYEAYEAMALCRRPTRGVIEAKRIFAFLKSRGARMSCPFCGQEQWHGWDERVSLEHVIGSKTVDRRNAVLCTEATLRAEGRVPWRWPTPFRAPANRGVPLDSGGSCTRLCTTSEASAAGTGLVAVHDRARNPRAEHADSIAPLRSPLKRDPSGMSRCDGGNRFEQGDLDARRTGALAARTDMVNGADLRQRDGE